MSASGDQNEAQHATHFVRHLGRQNASHRDCRTSCSQIISCLIPVHCVALKSGSVYIRAYSLFQIASEIERKGVLGAENVLEEID